jgi:hypothetical protein
MKEVAMRGSVFIGSLAALLALCACEGGTREQTTKGIEVPEGDYQARLQAMSEAERNAVFIRAIRDASLPCQHVQSSSFEGETAGAPTWRARCDETGEWFIVIGRDGVAQVADATGLRGAKPADAGNSQ